VRPLANWAGLARITRSHRRAAEIMKQSPASGLCRGGLEGGAR
jgi:hypothetical protein